MSKKKCRGYLQTTQGLGYSHSSLSHRGSTYLRLTIFIERILPCSHSAKQGIAFYSLGRLIISVMSQVFRYFDSKNTNPARPSENVSSSPFNPGVIQTQRFKQVHLPTWCVRLAECLIYHLKELTCCYVYFLKHYPPCYRSF